MKRFQFADEEYIKLSEVTGVPLLDIQKLDAMGLLDNKVAVKMVLEYEYKHQRKTNKVLPKLIIQAIANKYGMTTERVKRYLFARERPVFYCSRCQRETSPTEYKRNGGLCDKCIVETLTL